MSVTRPTVEDFLGWLHLQSAPSEEASAAYTESLNTALDYIEGRITLPEDTTDEDYPQQVRTAVLITAARFEKLRAAPEGVAGFGDFGPVRIIAKDQNVENLLAPYLTLTGFY